MKLKDLFESIDRIPVTVEYEWEDPAMEHQPRWVEVDCVVTVTTDPYATGDSPTEKYVDIKSATLKDTGKPFDLNQLNKSSLDWIEQQAADKA